MEIKLCAFYKKYLITFNVQRFFLVFTKLVGCRAFDSVFGLSDVKEQEGNILTTKQR